MRYARICVRYNKDSRWISRRFGTPVVYIKDRSPARMPHKKHVEFNDTPSYDTDPRTEPIWRHFREQHPEHRVSILKNLLLALQNEGD